MQNSLFVIDGTDGSGKKTQVAQLVSRLEAEGYKTATMDFPRYGEPSAWFVEQYLAGAFGSNTDVHPEQASLYYALDRYAHRERLRDMLSAGKIVVLDRYVSANIGHQAAKIPEHDDRTKFIEWLEHLEYDQLGLPRPKLQILLHLPVTHSIEAMQAEGRTGDLHENDHAHLEAAERAFLEAARRPNWAVIPCADAHGKRLSRDIVAERVWNAVHPFLPAR